jgi:hypothetical protein
MWYMVSALVIIAPNFVTKWLSFLLLCHVIMNIQQNEKLYGLVMQDSVISIQFIILSSC